MESLSTVRKHIKHPLGLWGFTIALALSANHQSTSRRDLITNDFLVQLMAGIAGLTALLCVARLISFGSFTKKFVDYIPDSLNNPQSKTKFESISCGKVNVHLYAFDSASPQYVFVYGNGNAGMVYKGGWSRQFCKSNKLLLLKDGPSGYYPANGKLGKEHIHCKALVSIPLAHEKHPDLIYGVLNVDSAAEDTALLEFISRTHVFDERPMDDDETKMEKIGLKKLNSIVYRGLRNITDNNW